MFTGSDKVVSDMPNRSIGKAVSFAVTAGTLLKAFINVIDCAVAVRFSYPLK